MATRVRAQRFNRCLSDWFRIRADSSRPPDVESGHETPPLPPRRCDIDAAAAVGVRVVGAVLFDIHIH